ncbi:MAG: hypothetical protein ACOCVY_03065 [Patescibacteria group bacterium]
MGLLTSNKKGGKFDKFKNVTGKDAEGILEYIDDRHKQKVKKYLEDVDKEKKSIHEVSQEIQEGIGSEAKRKFMRAAEKHAGGGLTEKEKRRNLARRREETGDRTGYIRSTATFAKGSVDSSHRGFVKSNPGNSDNAGSGFINSGSKRSVGINDSSEKGGKKGFINSQGSSFAGNSGKNNSGSGEKRGGKKPLGL